MAGRLEGKVAVVTGAASGIGKGTVELFAAEGAKVIAADISDDRGARLEEAHKGAVKYVHCDVLDEAQVAAAVKAAEREFGKLDVLFNNAGAGGARDMADAVTAEGFDAVMHLHLRAALFGMKYAVPLLKKQGGGAIVSTASVAGLRVGYGPLLYSIAKAAIIQMTKVSASQLAPFNIRVNCVCPGMIATNIFASALGVPSQVADTRLEALAEAGKTLQPLRRGGLPRDIAEGVLYLASDGADWVTGLALTIDGGLTLGPQETEQMATLGPIIQALGIDPEMLAATQAGQG